MVPLEHADADTCGAKAAALGTLLRAGLPVPDGFVLPFAAYRSRTVDLAELGSALARLGPTAVAVRSSATGEDSGSASAAGQYESTLAVRGTPAAAAAIRSCWASLQAPRATAYRARLGTDRPATGSAGASPAMAVLVQRHIDADVSGVMITTDGPDGDTVIECARGLGPSVVGGTVTPDTYRVGPGGTVTLVAGDQRTRLDRVDGRLASREVPDAARGMPSLDDATAHRLAAVGERAAAVLGAPQDVEWALVDGEIWLLQARPVTATLPPVRPQGPAGTPSAGRSAVLTGTPGSGGAATGPARTVRSPDDFGRVLRGDVLLCPFTDPSWTPLLRLAAAVVTERGGVLSHAAIVAREHGIPAVLGVTGVLAAVPDGMTVTVDGTAGTVTVGS
ncbi:MAG: PEP/pyruvate-binding domain-containing protein [Kineosporiaceae bacterium]